jgi:hypothetical protein
MIARTANGLMLCLFLSFQFLPPAARADTINLTLDGNFSSPDYSWYTYTDTAGASQTDPVGPYITYLSGGAYSNTLAYTFCYDINSETDVGTSYSGQFEVLTDTATMEATYLINELNVLGGFYAPLDERGAISLAIWEIMYPSSTTNGPVFDSDPAAQPYELEAADAVEDGSWTAADSALYPTWVPDDSDLQRFGVILDGVTAVTTDSPTPEPASFGLMALGVIGLAALSSNRSGRNWLS